MGWLASERGVNGGGISGILSSLQPDWKGEAGKGQRLRLGEIRSRTWCRQPLAPAQAGAGKSWGGGRDVAPGVTPPPKKIHPFPGGLEGFGFIGHVDLHREATGVVPRGTLKCGWFSGEKPKCRLSAGCFPAGFQAGGKGKGLILLRREAESRKPSGKAEQGAGESKTLLPGGPVPG